MTYGIGTRTSKHVVCGAAPRRGTHTFETPYMLLGQPLAAYVPSPTASMNSSISRVMEAGVARGSWNCACKAGETCDSLPAMEHTLTMRAPTLDALQTEMHALVTNGAYGVLAGANYKSFTITSRRSNKVHYRMRATQRSCACARFLRFSPSLT